MDILLLKENIGSQILNVYDCFLFILTVYYGILHIQDGDKNVI